MTTTIPTREDRMTTDTQTAKRIPVITSFVEAICNEVVRTPDEIARVEKHTGGLAKAVSTPAADLKRRFVHADWNIRVCTPLAWRYRAAQATKAGLADEAKWLLAAAVEVESLPPVMDQESFKAAAVEVLRLRTELDRRSDADRKQRPQVAQLWMDAYSNNWPREVGPERTAFLDSWLGCLDKLLAVSA